MTGSRKHRDDWKAETQESAHAEIERLRGVIMRAISAADHDEARRILYSALSPSDPAEGFLGDFASAIDAEHWDRFDAEPLPENAPPDDA